MSLTDPQQRHLGKFRGTVVNVEDPMRRGRIMAQVPDVNLFTPTTWALPCVPFAGLQSGAWMLPPLGSGVWIEFEQGDVDHPVWTGGWWGSAAEPPALAQAAPASVAQLILQTTGQNTLLVSDVPGPTGGILLKTATGALISINDVGITISNGKGAIIALTGTTVSVNGPSLVVS